MLGVVWCVVSRSVHATMYQVFDRELSHLLDVVLAGDVVDDRETAERLVRTVGALVHLHEQHPIDAHGRCAACVQWWPWRRATCSVRAALSYFRRATVSRPCALPGDMHVRPSARRPRHCVPSKPDEANKV